MIDQRNDAAHRSFQTDMPYESARVDAGDNWNSMLREVLVERFGRPPVAWNRRHALDDECFQERFAGFDIFGIDAGVADQRIRHRDDLTGVGGVCQDLLITRHGCIENDFAYGFTFKAVSVAPKNAPILEQQRRAFFQSKLPILFIGQYLKTALP